MDELEAERGGALADAAEDPCALGGKVVVSARVLIDQLSLERAIHQNGEFPGSGGNGLGRTQAGLKAAEEGTQGTMTVMQTLGREA